MACNTYTLKGIARGCKDSIGGIKKVYLSTSYDDVIKGIDVSTNILTITADAVATFKPFNFFKNTGSMTSTAQIGENTGNSWQTELNLVFMKQETSKKLEIEGMVMGECAAIVVDMNGKYWFLGKDNALTASAGTAETGTASTDLNGYNVTLLDESLALPYEITDAATKTALEALTVG